MRYNPTDSSHLRRLRDAINWSRKSLDDFLNQYIQSLRDYVGHRYGRGGAPDKLPLNMVRLAVDVWQRKLVTRTPTVLSLTRNLDLKPRSYELQLGVNHLLKEINLGEYLQEITKMALLGFGAMKVGIEPTMNMSNPNYRLDPGQPYAEPILWEDWFHDMNARRKDEWDFAGNRYRVDYEDMLENPMFDEQAKAAIQPGNEDVNDDGMMGDEERRSTISNQRGHEWNREEYRQHIELMDVWLPRDNLIVTLATQSDTPPLLVREWEGPERGPYHFLSFCKVPGNVLPAAPAGNIYDMNDLLNRMFRKIGRQGERQKTVTLLDLVSANDGTADLILKAEDGQAIPVQNPAAAKEMKFGGVDQNNMGFTVWLRQMASYMAGNLDLIGGLSAQSATAKQDQILNESGSEFVADLQGELEVFTSGVVTDLAWYLYHDPFIRLPLTKRIPGTDIEIPFTYGPEHREADFFEYSIQLQVHSLRGKSPEQRLAAILQMTTQVVLPLLPLIAQQGMVFNVKEFLRIVSQYADLPEIEDILTELVFPMGAPGGGPGNELGGSAPTERRYVRESRSTGGTQPARDQVLMQSLMSGGGQVSPQQMQAAMEM